MRVFGALEKELPKAAKLKRLRNPILATDESNTGIPQSETPATFYMNLPAHLVDHVRQHQVVLFLGAGASLAARSPTGESPPTGAELAKMLSEKFLGGAFNQHNLSAVSEYAASESSILNVQHYIRDVFEKFEPSNAHRLMTRFNWKAVATTNYDLLVEKAYNSTLGALQIPVPFIENGDQVEERLRDAKGLVYLKLHGCISRAASTNSPLILSMDQYIQYKKGRDRLFLRLQELAYEHTFVFVGHSGQDPDIRESAFNLAATLESRPRFYAVLPGRTEIEKRAFEAKRVTILDGTFEDFLNALDGEISDVFRALPLSQPESHPITKRFRTVGESLSRNCTDFLTTDAAYVSVLKAYDKSSARDFYRGYLGGWSAIEQSFDIRRDFADDVITDYILVDDLHQKKPLEFILLKGYAGSGKTVSLRRIAWDGAHDYDRLCIYLDDNAHINIGAIQELIHLCNERVFLFIDNAADRIGDIRQILNEMGDQGELLTLIAASRNNEWNTVSGDVQAAVTAEYEACRLNQKEIAKLLENLEKHKALGRLVEKSPEERVHEFEIAGRQLLVALHEATMGITFEEILENEFNRLTPPLAKQVYLTICVLNRLGIPVRAGLISRIHGLPFSEFGKKLFKPLEHIVYTTLDARLRDYVYEARHVIIADIVFERVLRNAQDRFEEYYRTLGALDVGYSTDAHAFRHMVKGRTLLRVFPSHEHCEALLELATEIIGKEPNLLQQKALYEMHRPNGNLTKALDYLNHAISIQPYNKAFKHTKAELALKKVDSARTQLEKEKLLHEAVELASETKTGRAGGTHSHHTLAKVHMKRLEEAITLGEADFTSPLIQSIVKNIERELENGLQAKPGDSYLLTEQARLAELLNNSPKMFESLTKAFTHNTKLGYLAVQLASCLVKAEKPLEAKKVLEKALQSNRSDRSLNYRYALLLADESASPTDICYYLKRSFTQGDQNFDAQLRYCRALFMSKDYNQLREELRALKHARTPPYLRNEELYYLPYPVQGKRHARLPVKLLASYRR